MTDQSRKSDSRNRILETAVELLGIHGFASMTMRQLGDAVGLDNSSLYRHFKNKSDLVNAAIDRVAGGLLAELEPKFDPSAPPSLSSLGDIAGTAGAYLHDRPASARLMVHWFMSLGDEGPGFQVSVDAQDTTRPGGALLASIKQQLDSAVAAGTVRPLAMPDALIMLIGALMLRPATRGYFLISLEPKQSATKAKDAWIGELRATVRRMLAP